jgi:hypothetical protein
MVNENIPPVLNGRKWSQNGEKFPNLISRLLSLIILSLCIISGGIKQIMPIFLAATFHVNITPQGRNSLEKMNGFLHWRASRKTCVCDMAIQQLGEAAVSTV